MGRKSTLQRYADYKKKERLMDYNHYYHLILQKVTSQFKWTGFPKKDFSTKYLEKYLSIDGCVVIFKRKDLGFLQVARVIKSGFNCYEQPVSLDAYDVTGMRVHLTQDDDYVLIYNNVFESSDIPIINFYANQLEEFEKAIRVNTKQLKHPVIFTCREGQKLSVEQFIDNVESGLPYLEVKPEFFEENTFQAYDMKCQNHTTELQQLKRDYFNECLTYFGINNVNILKKERLISDEANQNNEEIDINLMHRLTPREEACTQLKEKFGLDVKVECNYNKASDTKGGVQDGERDNDSERTNVE